MLDIPYIRDEIKLNSLLSLIVQNNDKLNVVEELQHENHKCLVQFIYILYSIVQTFLVQKPNQMYMDNTVKSKKCICLFFEVFSLYF
jgi:hypothetical protein